MFKAGDVIGFSGANPASDVINLATFGIPRVSLSHVAIVGPIPTSLDALFLFESTTDDSVPCIITGRPIAGSQAHPIEDRIAAYKGAVWHYPLYRRLYAHEALRLGEFLRGTIGRPYDTLGAARAGGFIWSWVESLLHPSNIASLFCSEWVAAAHATIGIFPTTKAGRWNPNLLTRMERADGILREPWRLK